MKSTPQYIFGRSGALIGIWRGWRHMLLVRVAGIAVVLSGVALMGVGTLHANVTATTRSAIAFALADPGCAVVGQTRCLKEAHEGAVATAFTDQTLCSDAAAMAHPQDDYWHFVVPAASGWDFDPSSKTNLTATFDTGAVTADHFGGPGNKFGFVLTPAGSTLEEAIASNVVGTGLGDFNLSGTCPAAGSSSTTSTTSSSSTSSTSTSSTSSTSSSTSTSSTSSSSSSSSSSRSTSSSSTTTSSSSSSSSTPITVSSSSSSKSGGAGGVLGITTPNTGAAGDGEFALGLLLLLAGAGVTFGGSRGRRKG